MESVIIAIEIYFLAFVVAMLVACLIKVIQAITNRVSPKKQIKEITGEGK